MTLINQIPTVHTESSLALFWVKRRAHEGGRIFQVTRLGTKLKQDALPLSYTPRKLLQHPLTRLFYVIESDHRVMGDEALRQKVQEMVSGPNLLCQPFSSLP